jgi:hypothetical protein
MTLEIFEHRVVGPLQCNCYIVGDPAAREAIVIDPGDYENELAEILATRQLNVTGIVATHAHFDHIVAAGHLREVTGAPFYLHDADVPLLDWMQTSGRIILDVELPPPPDVDVRPTEGDVLQAGGLRLEVLHTPGHSPRLDLPGSGRRDLRGRHAVRRFGRAHGPPGRRLATVAESDHPQAVLVRGGPSRVPGPRAGHDPGRGAPVQPVRRNVRRPLDALALD